MLGTDCQPGVASDSLIVMSKSSECKSPSGKCGMSGAEVTNV